jgi:hypothetical protein
MKSKTVVGVFQTETAAEQAVKSLASLGVDRREISLLTANSTPEGIAEVSTTDMEATGIGKAFGGLVGGALGAAGGAHLGMAAASTMLPGAGLVIAGGVAAAAVLGTGGAVGGAALGELVEHSLDEGLPKDELYIYEDALRHGRTIVIFQDRNDHKVDAARQLMAEAGAEDLDAARESWWTGLRTAEEQHYSPAWGDFTVDEPCYRMGFQAAQNRTLHGKSYASALTFLQERYPIAVCNDKAFRRGFERGQAHCESRKREGALPAAMDIGTRRSL